jgi:hypothetical protein
MAKSGTIKDVLKKLEETKGIVAAEAEKVGSGCNHADSWVAETSGVDVQIKAYSNNRWYASVLSETRSWLQIELYGQCPPIEKMDAALAGLKACK